MASGTIKKSISMLDYETLLNGVSPSTTSESKTIYNGRKLSDYVLYIATVIRGGGVRCSVAVPRANFLTNSDWISMTEVDSVNTQRWYEIHKSSDTQVTIQKSNSASSDNVIIYLYGIKLA